MKPMPGQFYYFKGYKMYVYNHLALTIEDITEELESRIKNRFFQMITLDR